MSASKLRWARLFGALDDMERLFEMACRIDQREVEEQAYRDLARFGHTPVGRPPCIAEESYTRFERRLQYLERLVDEQCDRLTAERLKIDHARKVRQREGKVTVAA